MSDAVVQPGKIAYLDGLRGFAALLVIVAHSAIFFFRQFWAIEISLRLAS